jgi:hypothetical protein
LTFLYTPILVWRIWLGRAFHFFDIYLGHSSI